MSSGTIRTSKIFSKSNFKSHSIDGETFLSVSDEQLKEVAEKIPNRVKLKKNIDSAISAEKVSDMFCVTIVSSVDCCPSVLDIKFSLKQKPT